MNISKTISTVGIGAGIIVGSMLAVNAASAHNAGGTDEKQAERVSELAERFNLDENELKTYFEEQKAEHEAEHQQKQEERLASLVAEGKLTQAQADALKAKREEMKASFEAAKDQNLTREERRTQMKQNRDDFKTWADSQGIDLEVIHPEDGPGEGKMGPRDGMLR